MIKLELQKTHRLDDDHIEYVFKIPSKKGIATVFFLKSPMNKYFHSFRILASGWFKFIEIQKDTLKLSNTSTDTPNLELLLQCPLELNLMEENKLTCSIIFSIHVDDYEFQELSIDLDNLNNFKLSYSNEHKTVIPYQNLTPLFYKGEGRKLYAFRTWDHSKRYFNSKLDMKYNLYYNIIKFYFWMEVHTQI